VLVTLVPAAVYHAGTMTSTKERLTPEAVLAWSGTQELNKGRGYVADLDDLMSQPGSAGLTLTGSAYGQEAYRVQAVLRGGQVSRGQCSCPVGGGGHCKHIAALLTRYSAAPQDFEALMSLDEALKDQTAAQLRKVIGELLVAAPELTALVCTPMDMNESGADQPPQVATLPAMFRAIKRSYHSDWQYNDEGLDTSGPDGVMDEADELRDGQPEQALAIYLALVEQIESAYETWADADDEPFADLMSAAVSGLATLVAEDRLDERDRYRAVSTLLNLENLADLASNEDFGEYAEALRPSERAELRALLQQWHDNAREHRRAPFARALLQLIPRAEQTPEAREALLLSSRNPYEVAAYYLTEDPRPGASDRLRHYLVEVQAYLSLEPLLATFKTKGAEGALETILVGRLQKSRSGPGRLSPELEWLFGHYVSGGRREQALELAKAGLLSAPSVAWEGLLRQVSLDWANDWSSVYRILRVQPNQQNAVAHLLLNGHHDLSEAEGFDREHGGQISGSLRHALAIRLGRDPATLDRAVQIVLELANALIQARGRKNYQAAAGQLMTLTDLLGLEGGRERVARIAEANRHLPSFLDELRKAGLV
jgi:uncharacterized Zn finger protein